MFTFKYIQLNKIPWLPQPTPKEKEAQIEAHKLKLQKQVELMFRRKGKV